MNVKSIGLLGVIALSSAVCAEEAHEKYDLIQNVMHNAEGGPAFENAKWWTDSSGVQGTDGATPDANGDYYSHGYRIDTKNIARTNILFNCHSLHIGDEDKSSSLYIFVSGTPSSFGVGGDGLYLHRGLMGLQWYPVTLTGRITVESPDAEPFKIYDAYSGTTNHLQAALCAEAGKTLWVYANNAPTQYSESRQFVVNLTGDCSAFCGTLKIGKASDDQGRTTRLVLNGMQMPGTLAITETALLDLGSAAASVGSLSLANGATLLLGGGALTVTTSFSMAGRVTVSGTISDFGNVAAPTVDFLTLPKGAACDPSNFDCTATVATSDGRQATVSSIGVRTNDDGTKTVYATLSRPTVYVSPTGDDTAAGTEAAPLRTLAKAVSVCAGGVIYALPGRYEEGLCDESETATQSRVHLPAETLLVSTAGAAETTIVGAAPTSPAEGASYGAGAARCVRLDAGSVLQGFTLTGGYVSGNSDSDFANSSGGGALGCEGSVVIDCVFDGNTARRGGGCRGGAYVRCTFGRNVSSLALWAGTDVFGINSQGSGVTRVFDCLFTRTDSGSYVTYVHHSVRLYNCTVLSEGSGGFSELCKAYNCILRTKTAIPGNLDYYNCVLGSTPTMTNDYQSVGCVVADVSLNDSQRPRSRRSVAVDFGDVSVYEAAWDEAGIDRAYFGKDYAGGPRFFGKSIDAGCGEFNRPLLGAVLLLR